jgi:hypothetical protein
MYLAVQIRRELLIAVALRSANAGSGTSMENPPWSATIRTVRSPLLVKRQELHKSSPYREALLDQPESFKQ